MSKLEKLALWKGGAAMELVNPEIKEQRLNRLNEALDTLQEIDTLLRGIKVTSDNLKNVNSALAKFRNELMREVRQLYALLDAEA